MFPLTVQSSSSDDVGFFPADPCGFARAADVGVDGSATGWRSARGWMDVRMVLPIEDDFSGLARGPALVWRLRCPDGEAESPVQVVAR